MTIFNISGRTDIIGFYSEWFFNRLKAGFVDVPNPFDPHQITRYSLKKEDVDILLFTTKNPLPLLNYLDALHDYPCMFQITLTPYGRDLEPHVPDKNAIIKAIQKLAHTFGKETIWLRYDPILLNARYTISEHEKAFAYLLSELSSSIERVIISFVDEYKNTLHHGIHAPTLDDMHALGSALGRIAKAYHMPVQTCSESVNLEAYGIKKGRCVDPTYLSGLVGHPIAYTPQKKRPCDCCDWRDIGMYNSCLHLCRYCYANFDEKKIQSRYEMHDPQSTMLIGHLKDDDVIHEYRLKHQQLSLF